MAADDDFYTPEELEHIKEMNSLEKAVHPDETPEQTANRIFKENLPNAARSIATLAMKGATERVRLDASKYIVERIMGKLGDAGTDPEDGPLTDLFGSVIREEANNGTS